MPKLSGKTETARSAPSKGRANNPKPDRQSGFSQDMAGRQAFDKALSKEATQAVVPAARRGRKDGTALSLAEQGAANAARQTRKGRLRDITRNAPQRMVPRLDNWLKLLARPFTNPIVKCPINYNPVPSFMTSLARATSTVGFVSVAASTCTQITLFGGHGLASETESMDGVAYHARLQTVNATNYTIGPINTSAPNTAIGGVISSNLAIGAARVLSNTANDAPLGFDVALPYLAAPSESGHTRWKLVAMGLRAQNMTSLEQRAGNIVSVQPANKGSVAVDYTSQNLMASNPSYQISERANTGTFEVSWIPRPEDLGFWHTIAVGTESAVAALSHGGLFVFINNPNAAAAQTYQIQVVYHYELSGTYLQGVSSPSIHQPADKNVVEPLMDMARFTSAGAEHAVEFAKHIAGNIGPMRAGAVPIMGAGMSGAAKLLLDTMAG